LLNDSEVSYAELTGNNIRSVGIRGAVKDKVKVKVTDVSRYFFRSNECKPPVLLQMWVSFDIRNMISQRNTSCRGRHVIGGIYMML